MHAPVISRVSPRAARYLSLLVEFGHLDLENAERLLMMAAETYPGTDRVPLSFVRRVAAAAVISATFPLEGGDDLLSDDWPLLFH